MITFSRSDTSLIARWWWTVDRWMLVLVMVLVALGLWLTLSASPAVANRLGLDSFHFVRKQTLFLSLAVPLMIAVSMCPDHVIRRISILMFPGTLLLLILTLLVGPEIKGATRWLSLGGFGLQPSEFLKPFFVVVTAWLLSADFTDAGIPAKAISTGVFCLVALLLLLQPDFGQTVLIGGVWLGQMALAGLPLMGLMIAAVVGAFGLSLGYLLLPHVASRIDRFLDPTSGDTYQSDKALDAFEAGGFFGRGPGEGSVKLSLPDAHTDYIFAVAGEEFGAFAAVMLLLLFAGIVVRGLAQLLDEDDPFRLIAAAGLLMQFGLQVIINIGVSLGMLPSKGMTLPFISYGGSSLLALAVTMGMVLALTRRNRFLGPSFSGATLRSGHRQGWAS